MRQNYFGHFLIKYGWNTTVHAFKWLQLYVTKIYVKKKQQIFDLSCQCGVTGQMLLPYMTLNIT